MARHTHNADTVYTVDTDAVDTDTADTVDTDTADTVDTDTADTVDTDTVSVTDIDAVILVFRMHVEEAIRGADVNGSVDSTDLATVTSAYQALSGTRAKNAARAWVQAQAVVAVNNGNLANARALMVDITNALVAAKATKAAIDPKAAIAARLMAHKIAGLALATDIEDAGLDQASLSDEVTAAIVEGFETGNLDPAVVNAARKMAAIKVAGHGGRRVTYNGPRRSVKAHIIEAFDDAEAGDYMSIADICAFRSDTYGDDSPSSGAVANALFVSGVDGIVAIDADSTRPKGGMKA